MPTLRLPDGSVQEFAGNDEVVARTRGAVDADFVPAPVETAVGRDVALATDLATSAYNDPVGTATSVGRGVVRTAIPGGTDLLRGIDEFTTQFADSTAYADTAQEAERNHPVAGYVGNALGIGAGLGTGFVANPATGLAGVVGVNMLEAGLYGAADAGLHRYTEDMLDNPELTSELMAANALAATLRGGAQGALIGGGLTLGIAGAGRLASVGAGVLSDGVNGIRARAAGASPEAVEIAIRSLGGAPGDTAAAARGVNAAPLGDMAQAVRLAEREGVDAMQYRVNRSAVADAVAASGDLGGMSMPRSAFAKQLDPSMADIHYAAAEALTADMRAVRGALQPLQSANPADMESMGLINLLNGSSKVDPSVANRLGDFADALGTLERNLASNSPEYQDAVRPLVARIREVMTDESALGKAGSLIKANLEANDAIAAFRAKSPESITQADLDQLAERVDLLDNIAAQAVANPSRRGRVQPQAAKNQQAAQAIRDAADRMRMAQKVAEVSREVGRLHSDPGFLHSIGKWASRAVGNAVGGVPGAFVADNIYKAASEAGGSRQAIWAAQNAYDRFTGRAADALLSYVKRPRPAGVKFEFSQAQYADAVNSVKRAAGMPVTAFAGGSEASTVAPKGRRGGPLKPEALFEPVTHGPKNQSVAPMPATWPVHGPALPDGWSRRTVGPRNMTRPPRLLSEYSSDAADSVARSEAVRSNRGLRQLRGTPEQRAKELENLPPFLRNT